MRQSPPLSYGNPPSDPSEERDAALTSAAIYDASPLGRLKVTGTDGLDLLHRLSTNAVEKLAPNQGANTILTDDRGRIIDLLTVVNLGDHVLLLTSPNQQDRIIAWLDKYTIIEDITVQDISSVVPAPSPVIPVPCRSRGGGNPRPRHPYRHARLSRPRCSQGSHHRHQRLSHQPTTLTAPSPYLDNSAHLVRCDMTTLPNFYIIGNAATVADIWQRAIDSGATPMGLEASQALRVDLGIPAHGSELTDAYNPLEAGLMGAISFTKGCYIGQEVIARLDTYQKVQRRLVSLTLPPSAEPGTRLMHDNREVGILTSVSPLPANGQTQGLAYVRTAAAEPGARLTLGDTNEVASIKALLDPLSPTA